jgi:ribonuclease PH
VPPFLRTRARLVTAEYGMLPRATKDRTPREAARQQSGARSNQRLVAAAPRGREPAGVSRAHHHARLRRLEADAGIALRVGDGGFVASASLSRSCRRQQRRGNPFVGCVAAVRWASPAGPRRRVRRRSWIDYAEIPVPTWSTSWGRPRPVRGGAGHGRTSFSEEELAALLGSPHGPLRALRRAAERARSPPAAFKI